jgi:hypothetical protein
VATDVERVLDGAAPHLMVTQLVVYACAALLRAKGPHQPSEA